MLRKCMVLLLGFFVVIMMRWEMFDFNVIYVVEVKMVKLFYLKFKWVLFDQYMYIYIYCVLYDNIRYYIFLDFVIYVGFCFF